MCVFISSQHFLQRPIKHPVLLLLICVMLDVRVGFSYSAAYSLCGFCSFM